MKNKIVLYGLLLALFCSVSWNYKQWQASQRIGENLFYTYSYNDFDDAVIQTRKSNGKIRSKGVDRNGDNADDEIIEYSLSGKMLIKFFDNNFNGEFEETNVYNKAGVLMEKYKDLDEDGYIDIRTEYRNDSIFRLEDINSDGFIDTDEIVKRTYYSSVYR